MNAPERVATPLLVAFASVGAVCLPTPAVADNGGVAVVSSSSYTSGDGSIHVVGEVVNKGSGNAQRIEVPIDERTIAGTVLGSIPATLPWRSLSRR